MATKKSYEVRFGINDTEVSKQLANIDKSLNGTQRNIRLLKTSLSDNWDVSKWREAQEAGTKAVQDSIQKVELLKKRFAEMEAEGVTEKNQAAFEDLRREILASENAAEKAKKELQSINNIRLDAVKKQIEQVSERLTSIGNKLSVGVTAPIIAAGAASIKMASDMDEAINKVDVAFGEAANTVHSFSNTTLTTYGIAKSTALDMAALFGDMATSMGFTREEAADMSIELVALAGDLASFKNVSLDEAATALKSIFTGETESLKNLGVVMTDTNLQAYALANGIEKSTSEMGQSEKVALRLQYVLDNTKNAQGDFSRTSDSTANQLRILSESLKELAAIAGQELIPMVLPIIKQLNQIIQKVGQLDDGTKDMITKIALFAASFGPLLTVSGKLTGSIGTLIGAYKSLKTAQAAATVGQSTLNAAMSANPAGAVAAAIGVLISVLGSIAITSALTSDRVETLSTRIKNLGKDYEETVKSIEESADEERAELDLIERLIPKYEELNGKTSKTAQEKAELKRIVDEINSVVPDTITLVNEEAGVYETLNGRIRDVIASRRQEIDLMAARNRAVEASEKQQEITNNLYDEYGISTLEDAERRLAELTRKHDAESAGKLADFNESLWDPISSIFQWDPVYKDAVDVGDEINALEEYIAAYKKYEAVINEYTESGSSGSSSSGFGYGGGGSTSSENALNTYKSLRAALDHQLAMDEISTEQYYATLERYDRDYLAGYAENISEHRSVLEELHKYRKNVQEEEAQRLKELAEAEKKALEELAEAEKKAREESLKNAEEFTDTVVSLAEKEANAKIAAIDAELAARDKLKAAQEAELKLQQAQAQLAFTVDEDSRESLQKEIDRLKEDIAEQEYQNDMEAQKAAIQAQLDQLKADADSAISNLQANLTPESVNPYITQLAPNLTVNAQGLSIAQAQMLIQQAIKKALYE